jgi:hypothetical protein
MQRMLTQSIRSVAAGGTVVVATATAAKYP